MRMDRRRLSLLVSALFILVLGGFSLATYRRSSTLQSTFNIQPGLTYALSTNRSPSDTIAGHFQVTSGTPVSFYIMTSAQYSSAQIQASFQFLYNASDSSLSSIAFTFPAQDTYYLVFDHGTGYSQTTETVYFQRTYTSSSVTTEALGVIFLIFGGASLAIALRSKDPSHVGNYESTDTVTGAIPLKGEAQEWNDPYAP